MWRHLPPQVSQNLVENTALFTVNVFIITFDQFNASLLGVDRLSAPILSILPIIDIGHFQNRFADNLFLFFLLCKQTYYLQVTLFIGE